MKILWLSHLLPYPLKAGVVQRSYHLMKELARESELHVLAFRQDGLMAPMVRNLEQGVEDAVEHLGQFCTVIGVHAIPSERRYGKQLLALASFFHPAGYTLNWLKSGSFKRDLRKALQNETYDLIHLDTISFAPYLSVCEELAKGVPVVLDHHNIESHMMWRRTKASDSLVARVYFGYEARKLERAEKAICPRVTLNITCSDVDSERLATVTPQAASVDVPNAVDTHYFSPTSGGGARLLFFGTMSWYPNIEAAEFLIKEIAPELERRHPELMIDIIGASPPSRILEAAAVRSNVTVHGFVDDIRDYVSEALAFLCPIKDGGGTKLKVLDAMAMALPIVANPVACEGIDLESGKSVVFAETPCEYLDAIERLAVSPDFARYLGHNARKLAEAKYSVNAIGERLRSIYRRTGKEAPVAELHSARAIQ